MVIASPQNPSVILMEDDTNLGYVLKENLEINGFNVTMFANGKDGLGAYHQNKFNACILDVMMPEMDGFTVAKEIRKKDQQIPIIFLTARSMKEDKLKGFRIGADDYITKPFSSEELVLRLKAILRRTLQSSETTYENIFLLGNSVFDFNQRKILSGKISQRLSTREADLLKLLCEHKNQVVRREIALKQIWGTDDYFASRSMDVFITRLRKFLKHDSSIELQNIHGTGFKLLG